MNVLPSQALGVIKTIFSELDEETITEISQHVAFTTYPAHSQLCKEGHLEQVFYIIVDGTVDVTKTRSVDGKSILLQRKEPGDFFGEMGLMTESPRTADVYASTNVELLEMTKQQFLNLIQKYPQFAIDINKVIEQYRNNHRRIEKQRITVFASYSRRNQELIARIVGDLRTKLADTSVYLWLDTADIRAGVDWDDQIHAALNEATAMLLFLSEDAVSSKHVKSEWHYFHKKDKTIIPVHMDDCEIPFLLLPLQQISIRDEDLESDYEGCIDRLAATLVKVLE